MTADDAEIQLFAHVNEARMNAGLSLLTPDPALARVARGHSGDMFANNFVAHVSPTTGGPGDRVAKAGLKPPRLLENVGTDSSPAEVHRGLMRSPGHRSAILDPEVTHVGIGVVVAPPGAPYRVVVTELFR